MGRCARHSPGPRDSSSSLVRAAFPYFFVNTHRGYPTRRRSDRGRETPMKKSVKSSKPLLESQRVFIEGYVAIVPSARRCSRNNRCFACQIQLPVASTPPKNSQPRSAYNFSQRLRHRSRTQGAARYSYSYSTRIRCQTIHNLGVPKQFQPAAELPVPNRQAHPRAHQARSADLISAGCASFRLCVRVRNKVHLRKTSRCCCSSSAALPPMTNNMHGI